MAVKTRDGPSPLSGLLVQTSGTAFLLLYTKLSYQCQVPMA